MPVYFIQAGEDGPVKIGKADDPMDRLALLQCGNAETLRIIRLIEGGHPEERALHRHYQSLRIRGEWFHFCATMMDVLPEVEPRKVWIPTESASYRSYFLRAVDAFCARTKLTERHLGEAALRNPKIVSRIRRGGHVTTDTIERLEVEMARASQSLAEAAH